MKKTIVLTFVPRYIPGVNGGGPIRTIAGLVETLGDELDFKIITLDRDLGSRKPYRGIQANDWQRVGKADVFYLSPEKVNFGSLHQLISDTSHDVLYLNSFFSFHFGIIPMLMLKFGMLPRKAFIMAPRGQFSSAALKLKSLKKRAYIFFINALNLKHRIIWHLSSRHELEDLNRIFKKNKALSPQLTTVIAPDLSDLKPTIDRIALNKEPGRLKIVFLSRITPIKNLDGALMSLAGLQGQITFNIYGPLEDTAYWKGCEAIAEKLPSNIQVNYGGMIDHDKVISVMEKHHLFFLPTRGENFGHVIIEALTAGCPVLISDQTPWRNLEKKGIGWDLPLKRMERFTTVLQKMVDMGTSELESLSSRAKTYAHGKIVDENAIKQNRDLFYNAVLKSIS